MDRASLLFVGAVLAAVQGGALAEEAPGGAPVLESELKGEEKRKYEEELKGHLVRLRTEKNRERVAQFIEQLGGVGTRAARDALIQFARENKNHEFVDKSFHALAKIQSPVAVEFLCGKDGARSKDFLVQHSAVEALGEAKNPRCVTPLLEVLQTPSLKIEVLGAIAQTLAKSAPTDPRVSEALFRLAGERRDTVRANVVEAIGYLRSPQAVNHLVEVLRGDKNTRVRAAAALGLGHSGSKDAVAPLQTAVSTDKSMTVTEAAMKALKELGAVAK